ncbi:hypothetical protein FA95DRAFT_1577663 [Auriscalpium vulgare]|uniref:Uncharacterized protein n=1 Tax=Auriscalpium vulgare TaxID=40419 RepID=A0ACB8R6S0_9AGAM|nr:hypothetical protein FA95DRAFT_1577663 [Auriscalpium vulgare]
MFGEVQGTVDTSGVGQTLSIAHSSIGLFGVESNNFMPNMAKSVKRETRRRLQIEAMKMSCEQIRLSVAATQHCIKQRDHSIMDAYWAPCGSPVSQISPSPNQAGLNRRGPDEEHSGGPRYADDAVHTKTYKIYATDDTTPRLLRKCRAQETGHNPPVGTTCSKQKPTEQRRVTTKTGPKGEKWGKASDLGAREHGVVRDVTTNRAASSPGRHSKVTGRMRVRAMRQAMNNVTVQADLQPRARATHGGRSVPRVVASHTGSIAAGALHSDIVKRAGRREPQQVTLGHRTLLRVPRAIRTSLRNKWSPGRRGAVIATAAIRNQNKLGRDRRRTVRRIAGVGKLLDGPSRCSGSDASHLDTVGNQGRKEMRGRRRDEPLRVSLAIRQPLQTPGHALHTSPGHRGAVVAVLPSGRHRKPREESKKSQESKNSTIRWYVRNVRYNVTADVSSLAMRERKESLHSTVGTYISPQQINSGANPGQPGAQTALSGKKCDLEKHSPTGHNLVSEAGIERNRTSTPALEFNICVTGERELDLMHYIPADALRAKRVKNRELRRTRARVIAVGRETRHASSTVRLRRGCTGTATAGVKVGPCTKARDHAASEGAEDTSFPYAAVEAAAHAISSAKGAGETVRRSDVDEGGTESGARIAATDEQREGRGCYSLKRREKREERGHGLFSEIRGSQIDKRNEWEISEISESAKARKRKARRKKKSPLRGGHERTRAIQERTRHFAWTMVLQWCAGQQGGNVMGLRPGEPSAKP